MLRGIPTYFFDLGKCTLVEGLGAGGWQAAFELLDAAGFPWRDHLVSRPSANTLPKEQRRKRRLAPKYTRGDEAKWPRFQVWNRPPVSNRQAALEFGVWAIQKPRLSSERCNELADREQSRQWVKSPPLPPHFTPWLCYQFQEILRLNQLQDIDPTRRLFAEWISARDLDAYLSGRRFPTAWNEVAQIAYRLGPEVYDVLDLPRPQSLRFPVSSFHLTLLDQASPGELPEPVETVQVNLRWMASWQTVEQLILEWSVRLPGAGLEFLVMFYGYAIFHDDYWGRVALADVFKGGLAAYLRSEAYRQQLIQNRGMAAGGMRHDRLTTVYHLPGPFLESGAA